MTPESVQRPRKSADISVKPRACPCNNIYVTPPNLLCSICSACDDIVSKLLIVKEKGTVSEEKLATNFCLQLLGWCPCLNCRDFDPQPLQACSPIDTWLHSYISIHVCLLK